MRTLRLALIATLPCAALYAGTGASAATPDAVFSDVKAPAGGSLSALAADTPMSIVFSLPMRDRTGAEAYAAAVSQPGNALYGRYLTPQEFGARFGGDADNYEYLRNWAASQGLTVGERLDAAPAWRSAAQRLSLPACLPPASLASKRPATAMGK